MTYRVRFWPGDIEVSADGTETLVTLAARAGITLRGACGGAGTCGRCQVEITKGKVRVGEALLEAPLRVPACQAKPAADLKVDVPPSSRLDEHRVLLAARSTAVLGEEREALVPDGPLYRRVSLQLPPPSLEDPADDLSRLLRGLKAYVPGDVRVPLDVLRTLPSVLRTGKWRISVGYLVDDETGAAEVLDVARTEAAPYGLAVDVGTTTVAVELWDLAAWRRAAAAGSYNRQAAFGEDVISRIIYAAEQPAGLRTLQEAVVKTVNELIRQVLGEVGVAPDAVGAVTCAGNTTMLHLLLGVDPTYIRLEPYTPVTNRWPLLAAKNVGLAVNPRALVYILPGVASYVGGDITAGVVAAGVNRKEGITLFVDIGTNGEMVLGNRDWLVACACSAGPAFEGGGIRAGLRAVPGAIEEVVVLPGGYEVFFRTIGDRPPSGICGSGLISALAGLADAGVIDRSGRFLKGLQTPRFREGKDGPEFVIAWESETASGKTISLSQAEIENLLRAKAAVFAGIRTMLGSLGLTLDSVEEIYLAGGFGQHINIKDAVSIGMLPDLPPGRYHFIGNSALKGAAAALLSQTARKEMAAVARSMTHLELSVENRFMEEFTAALFLPHTDMDLFPSVKRVR
ncbi:MAG: ASKHA domain-containing protein [Desulfotomaculales bacterium]